MQIEQDLKHKVGLSQDHKLGVWHVCFIMLVASVVLNIAIPYIPFVMRAVHAFLLNLLLRWADASTVHSRGDYASTFTHANVTNTTVD